MRKTRPRLRLLLQMMPTLAGRLLALSKSLLKALQRHCQQVWLLCWEPLPVES